MREPCAHQQIALFIHRHTVPKQLVQPLAVGMLWAVECLNGLIQDGERRHQPHHHFWPPRAALGQRGEHRLQRVHGDESLATRCGHLGADVRHARHRVLVGFHAGLTARTAHANPSARPVICEGLCQVLCLVQHVQIVGQIDQHPCLVVLEFHGVAVSCGVVLAQKRVMSRGIFLKMMPCLAMKASDRRQRSA